MLAGLPLEHSQATAGLTGVAVLDRSSGLQGAIGSADVTLAWQPWFDLATGRPCGQEALVRWHRSGIGPVAPDDFLPIAEEAGLMPALDAWVLDAACRAAAAWLVPLEAGVNVASSSFCSVDLVDQVAETLRRTGLAPGRLVLEVTEQLVLQRPALVRERVRGLRELGVQVALDDFGIGCSALAGLRDLGFSRVKLDCALIRDVGQGAAAGTPGPDALGLGTPSFGNSGLGARAGRHARADAVARAVIGVGRATGVPVCAEGVETEGQLAFLRASGCAMAQGYLLALPGAAWSGAILPRA